MSTDPSTTGMVVVLLLVVVVLLLLLLLVLLLLLRRMGHTAACRKSNQIHIRYATLHVINAARVRRRHVHTSNTATTITATTDSARITGFNFLDFRS